MSDVSKFTPSNGDTSLGVGSTRQTIKAAVPQQTPPREIIKHIEGQSPNNKMEDIANKRPHVFTSKLKTDLTTSSPRTNYRE